MRFWDTSAIIALIVEEPPFSARFRQALREDPKLLVWTFTRIEGISAITSLRRAGTLNATQYAAAEKRLVALAKGWEECELADVSVRDQAERVVRAHGLKTLDALQLATALAAFGKPPRRRGFMTKDKALARAATAEGFEVL